MGWWFGKKDEGDNGKGGGKGGGVGGGQPPVYLRIDKLEDRLKALAVRMRNYDEDQWRRQRDARAQRLAKRSQKMASAYRQTIQDARHQLGFAGANDLPGADP